MDFQGESNLVFDEKGRVTIPKEVRETLASACAGMLTLVRNPDGCLTVYPRPVWTAEKLKMMNWPMEHRAWARAVIGSALDVEIDSAGRISIPQKMRETMKLGKKVMLRGYGDRYELWDEPAYYAYEERVFEKGWPGDTPQRAI